MTELNQIPTIEEEGLFDDYEAEEVTETEDTPIEEEVTETDSQPFLEVKYNKEAKHLTREEAIELSQKGLNYDKLHEKHNALNTRLEAIAKANGLDIESFLNSLDEMQREVSINNKVQELKQQYPNSDEQLLKELAEKELNIPKPQPQENKELKRQLEIFNRKYPDVDASKLDQEVYDLMEEGYTLLEAYREVQDIKDAQAKAELQKQEEVRKKNEANAKKSLGSTQSIGEVESDAFLIGLNS